jgi:phosphoenolpyruvate synthase/pyruvate phosphate dikinase
MKWIIYTRGTIHPYRIDSYATGVFLYSKKMNGVFVSTLYINRGPILTWAWDDKQIREVGRRIFKKCKATKKFNQHINSLKLYSNLTIEAAETIRKIDLSLKTNQELIRLFEFLDKYLLKAHGFLGIDVDALDIVSDEFLFQELKKELGKKYSDEIIADIYKKTLQPIYRNFMVDLDKELMQAALKNKTQAVVAINKIYEKFWWTKLGWENLIPHSEKSLEKMVIEYRKTKNLKEKIKETDQGLILAQKTRHDLIKKYHLGKNIKHWINFANKYALVHDLRKEFQVKGLYAHYLLMYEIARRFELKREDLEWLWHQEVKDILRGKMPNKGEIKKRKLAVGLWVKKNKILLFSGKKAQKTYKQEFDRKEKKLTEIKGRGVNNGIVRGKAKVCAGAEEAIRKVKNGQILICPMTLPDYLQAMKKAAAIVTDEGGITCHAAIISRELGIPWVVGTLIATKVFKDNDFIEVDAAKGIIKLIKK